MQILQQNEGEVTRRHKPNGYNHDLETRISETKSEISLLAKHVSKSKARQGLRGFKDISGVAALRKSLTKLSALTAKREPAVIRGIECEKGLSE